MIVDSLASLGNYISLCPRFETVCAYLETVDLNTLEDGKYIIDGDDVFMSVASGELRPIQKAALEVHNEYIDIQVVLGGGETFGWRDRLKCSSARGEYSPANDILFYDDPIPVCVTLSAGDMVVFFPGDAHAPLIGCGDFKKCIIKVRYGG